MAFHLEHPLSDSLHSDSTDTLQPSSLFLVESQHMPSFHYFRTLNSSPSLLSNRRLSISSIFQYSRKFHDPSLTYLAVNYLDRFLSCQEMPNSKPWILSLISLSCVSLAAKMRKPEISLSEFEGEGDVDLTIFETQTIERMENVILGALKWRMRSITPFSFSSFFLDLFHLHHPSSPKHALSARAAHLIFNLQQDINFLQFKPSAMAAAALLVASSELCPLQFPRCNNTVSQCPYVNTEEVMECYKAMRERVAEEESTETAVNVLDLQLSGSESDKSVTTVSSPPLRRKTNGRC